jgi:hypothetical protein
MVRLVANDEVMRLGWETTERLGLTGLIKIDFKHDVARDRYYVLEVNLRSTLWNHPVHCGPQARYSASKARLEMTAAWRRHIRQLPLILADDVFAGFHAWPRRVDEYLLSEPRVRSAFAVLQARGLPDVAFFGHTHHSCVWTLRGAVLERREGQRLALDQGGRHLVNVGTVGEPRDGSPLATKGRGRTRPLAAVCVASGPGTLVRSSEMEPTRKSTCDGDGLAVRRAGAGAP